MDSHPIVPAHRTVDEIALVAVRVLAEVHAVEGAEPAALCGVQTGAPEDRTEVGTFEPRDPMACSRCRYFFQMRRENDARLRSPYRSQPGSEHDEDSQERRATLDQQHGIGL